MEASRPQRDYVYVENRPQNQWSFYSHYAFTIYVVYSQIGWLSMLWGLTSDNLEVKADTEARLLFIEIMVKCFHSMHYCCWNLNFRNFCNNVFHTNALQRWQACTHQSVRMGCFQRSTATKTASTPSESSYGSWSATVRHEMMQDTQTLRREIWALFQASTPISELDSICWQLYWPPVVLLM